MCGTVLYYRSGMSAQPKRPIAATVESLVRLLERRPIVWVGAGLSMAAGYPSTWSLVQTMAKEADDPIDTSQDFTRVVDAFIASAGRGALANLLHSEFATVRQPASVHRDIARLAGRGKLAAVVTSNYDDLIEDALKAEGVTHLVQTMEDNADVGPDTLRVLKIHGSHRHWHEVILSGASHTAFEERYSFLMNQLRVMLQRRPIVFVGCSMTDPRILGWLAGLDASWAERLERWRPMMTESDWQRALAAPYGAATAAQPLARGNIRPLVVANRDEHLPRLWREAADRLAGSLAVSVPASITSGSPTPETPAPVAIRWLHLSDLHAGAPGQALWHQVRADFEDDLVKMSRKLGAPDLILLSGDLAFSGREYDAVDTIVGHLRDRLAQAHPGSPAPLLFAVPGNHDLMRPARRRNYLVLKTYGDPDDPDAKELFDELWRDRDVGLLQPLFADYTAWRRTQVAAPLRAAGAQVHESYFPGDISAVIEKSGFRLGLVGLNTAWLQYTSGDFTGRLHVPLEQFHRALLKGDDPLSFFTGCDAALLLMHHPRSWLHARAQRAFDAGIYPAGRFDLCLHGHLHAARSDVTAISGTQPRAFFQAPSLFGLERYGAANESRSFGYTFGELRSDGGLRVWPRVLIERGSGRWAFDRDQRFDDPADDGAIWLRRPRIPVRTEAARAATVAPARTAGTDWQSALGAYLDWACTEYGTIDMAGLGYGRLRVPLNDVYVPLRFHGCSDAEISSGALRTGRALHRGSDRDVDLESAFTWAQPAQHLLVMGDPGAGKTTALRKLMWSVIDRDGSAIGLPAPTVPVFLRLRDLRESDLRKPLGDFIEARLRVHAPVPEGLGTWLWQRGHILLLLDGLDEVADPRRRKRVCDYLEAQFASAAARGIRAVVSSRFAGLGEGIGFDGSFAELAIHPMNDEQIEALLTRWFEAAEITAARAADADADVAASGARGRQSGRDLAERLRAPEYLAPQLLELISNPLLLTLLCVVAFEGRQIPRERTEFFDDCLRTLLGRWRRGLAAPATEPFMSYADAVEMLGPVAWAMHVEARKYDLSRARLEELLRPEIAHIESKRRSVLPMGQVIDWLWRDAGVLTEYAPDEFGFMHLSLQEYLAAHRAAVLGSEGVARLAAEFGNEWWREVTLIFVALDRHRLFGALLEAVIAGGKLAIERALVRRCLNEAHRANLGPLLRVAEDTIRDVDEAAAAISLLTPYDSDERVRKAVMRGRVARQATRVLEDAQTGIRLLWIPGGEFSMGADDLDDDAKPIHRVRLSPFWLADTQITNQQYQQFVRATGHREPKFWRGRRLNQPEQPVVGVSWFDARAYCAWLQEQTDWPVDLPSEAQWEFAARGPENHAFPWGFELPDASRAHFGHSWMTGAPLPVGSLPAGSGPFGTLDQAGNVWEWCKDRYDPIAYQGRGALTGDPYESGDDASPDEVRVVRGGSRDGSAQGLRSAYRSRSQASKTAFFLSFRVSSSPAVGK